MRNGDFVPSRLQAQTDAANLLFTAKTQSNPESTVALMSICGHVPQVRLTLTSDEGKMLMALHGVQVGGGGDGVDLVRGLQVAQLVLKHRQNKNQRQRIVLFIGSPLSSHEAGSSAAAVVDEKSLVKLGKKLKKNNVAVDIVSFGSEHEQNTAMLQALIDAVNSNDNSHLVSVPPGPHILSDILISTPIVAGEAGAAGIGGGAGGAGGFEFGFDPSMDPELALALRLSMEEERARQESTAPPAVQDAAMTDASKTAATSSSATADSMLAQAMAMGQQQGGDVEMGTEEDEIARAIAMSMEKPAAAESTNSADVVSNVLGSLPGVDPNDARFKKQTSSSSNSSSSKTPAKPSDPKTPAAPTKPKPSTEQSSSQSPQSEKRTTRSAARKDSSTDSPNNKKK